MIELIACIINLLILGLILWFIFSTPSYLTVICKLIFQLCFGLIAIAYDWIRNRKVR